MANITVCVCEDIPDKCSPSCPFPYVGGSCTRTYASDYLADHTISGLVYFIFFFGCVWLFALGVRSEQARPFIYRNFSGSLVFDYTRAQLTYFLGFCSAFSAAVNCIDISGYNNMKSYWVDNTLISLTTVFLITIEIVVVTNWMAVIHAKGAGRAKPTRGMNVAASLSFFILFFGVIVFSLLELADVPRVEDEKFPEISSVYRGGNVGQFRGIYNGTMNTIKNQITSVVSLGYSSAGVFYGYRLTHALKSSTASTSSEARTQKTMNTIMHYMYLLVAGSMMQFVYAIITSISRFGTFVFEAPPCSGASMYIQTVRILHLIVMALILVLLHLKKKRAGEEREKQKLSELSTTGEDIAESSRSTIVEGNRYAVKMTG